MYGAKVGEARQEEISMRRDWDETGCGTTSRRCHKLCVRFPWDNTLLKRKDRLQVVYKLSGSSVVFGDAYTGYIPQVTS